MVETQWNGCMPDPPTGTLVMPPNSSGGLVLLFIIRWSDYWATRGILGKSYREINELFLILDSIELIIIITDKIGKICISETMIFVLCCQRRRRNPILWSQLYYTLLTHLPLDKMVAILADDIFKYIFFNENVTILIQISLKFVLDGPIENKSALVQVNGLAPNRWQAITWVNVDPVHCRIYGTLGGDESITKVKYDMILH